MTPLLFATMVAVLVVVTVICWMILGADRAARSDRYEVELQRREAERRLRHVTQAAFMALLVAARDERTQP